LEYAISLAWLMSQISPLKHIPTGHLLINPMSLELTFEAPTGI